MTSKSSVRRIMNGRIRAKDMVLYVLFFTIVMETLIVQFGFPSSLRYTNDIVIIGLLILMRFKIFYLFNDIKCRFITYAFGVLCCVLYISAFINLVPINLVIWATRNFFRGIIFFFATVYYFDITDLKKVFGKLYVLQLVNLLLVFYQYFILQHVQDEIGGIFGYGNGAGVNIFNALLMAYYINAYINKKESLYKLGVVILASFVIAALSEEKMTYVLFVIIFVYSIIATKFSFKKLGVIIIGIAGLTVGMIILKHVYPGMYEVMISFDELMNYATQTFETGYRIPRIGAFAVISELFFEGDVLKILFGLGFGNCETSNFSIFQSEFYEKYGTWNYRWFTHQWTFLECGFIGFAMFLLFFVVCILYMFSYRKKMNIDELSFLHTGITVGMCSIITMWYNATLKVDMCYIAYFGMAVGLIAVKNSFMKDNLDYENMYFINAKSS